jgi:hypothetical protein
VSLASLGVSDPPAILSIEDGWLRGAKGGLGPRFLDALTEHGELGLNLAVHVAFGASAAIGGRIAVAIHLDAIITDVTLSIDG